LKQSVHKHQKINWSEIAREAFRKELKKLDLADSIASKSELTVGRCRRNRGKSEGRSSGETRVKLDGDSGRQQHRLLSCDQRQHHKRNIIGFRSKVLLEQRKVSRYLRLSARTDSETLDTEYVCLFLPRLDIFGLVLKLCEQSCSYLRISPDIRFLYLC
jgi:hypothetical protein